MRIFVITAWCLLSLLGTTAWAQLDQNSLIGASATIDLKPAYPSPGEAITATLNDTRSTSFGASVTWSLNGVQMAQGQDQRSISFNAGLAGERQILTATIYGADGFKQILTRDITPYYLDLVIEPQTHVPDFYLGRALPSIGSSVNVTALLDGKKPTELVYLWRINNTTVFGGPIRGQNQVTFTTPRGDNFTLSVQISTLTGTTIASRSIVIPSVKPTVLFYESSPLYGLSQTALTRGLQLIGNSTTIVAEPYYLDSRVYNNPSVVEWQVDNRKTEAGSNPYTVTIQKNSQGGRSTLQFMVRDTTQVLQGGSGYVDLNY